MSEINGPKFSVNQINFNSVQKQPVDNSLVEKEPSEPQLKDLGDPKEVLGRSMLIKDNNINDNDNINSDLKALIDNPQIADNSDELFETAYNAAQEANIPNDYEEAATFATGTIK